MRLDLILNAVCETVLFLKNQKEKNMKTIKTMMMVLAAVLISMGSVHANKCKQACVKEAQLCIDSATKCKKTEQSCKNACK